MKKEWAESRKFGLIPFKEVTFIELKIKGFKSREEAAFLQYQLLLNEPILRAHVDFFNKKIQLIFNPLSSSVNEVIKLIPDNLKPEKTREKTISYEEFLNKTFHSE